MGTSNGLRALELAQLIATEVIELIDNFPPAFRNNSALSWETPRTLFLRTSRRGTGA